MAQPGAELSRAEVDYLFHHDLIFGSSDFEQMNLNYATELDLGKTLAMGAKLFWGVATRRFSRASLGRLLEVSSRAGRMRERYEAYPETPEGLAAWVASVGPLWSDGGDAHAG